MSRAGQIALFVCLVGFCAFSVYAAVVGGQRKDQIDDLKKQLVVQNVQMTKQIREAKADAFRDGLIVCGNEDVKWLNEQADYYSSLAGSNPLSKLMREWAQGWAYDDDTLNQMVETYMNGDSH